ncbi:MAG: thioredoxin domain-containing protein [bacterium]
MKRKWFNIGVIAILILVVFGVFILKGRTRKRAVANPGKLDSSTVRTFLPEPDTQVAVNSDSAVLVAKPLPQPVRTEAEDDILATVNTTPISKAYFTEKLRTLPEQYREMFQNDQEGFLEQLIVRELLYQEAVAKGFSRDVGSVSDEEEQKDRSIERLVQDLFSRIEVPEAEIQQFYEERKAEMRGATYEQIKGDIRNFLAEQKQGEVITNFIEGLRARAKISYNKKWLAQIRAAKPPDPLEVPLKSGKPTVLDLGAGYCVPCKMMKPIFDELKKEYGDRANIILLEISEHRAIANRYNVRLIPTQIFFDREGRVYWRHEGFLSKEEIKKKLKELGVE